MSDLVVELETGRQTGRAHPQPGYARWARVDEAADRVPLRPLLSVAPFSTKASSTATNRRQAAFPKPRTERYPATTLSPDR
jgi:hypothetical protein